MPANRQRLKSARVCPSRCECIYNDHQIKTHVYVPSTRQRPPTLPRRILELLPPPLFLPAQAEGLLPVATSLSRGPPCHGRLPSAIDSLGPLCGFWPLRQSQDPATRWGVAYITHSGNVLPPSLVGVHGITLLECRGRHLHVEKHATSRWSGRGSAANQRAS